MSNLFQRLLRGKGAQGMATANSLECKSVSFLREYVTNLQPIAAKFLPADDPLFGDIEWVTTIMGAGQKLPAEVLSAHEAIKSATPANHLIASALTSLPAGRRLLELAAQSAESRRHLSELDEMSESIQSIPAGVDMLQVKVTNKLCSTHASARPLG